MCKQAQYTLQQHKLIKESLFSFIDLSSPSFQSYDHEMGAASATSASKALVDEVQGKNNISLIIARAVKIL